MTNLNNSRYPSITLDGKWGSTFSQDLFIVDGVVDYLLNVNLTSAMLTGGTSPALSGITGQNPVITHLKIQANSEVIRDIDGALLNEYMKETRSTASDGYEFDLPMTDIQYSLKKRILNTLFPSFAYTSVKMYITLAPLSAITTGSPTNTSGATLTLNEEVILRHNVNFKLFDFRMIQISQSMAITGDNDLTNFLATDGYYKSLMYFTTSSSSAPYSNASDSIVNYVQLILNGKEILKDAYWTSLKSHDRSLFGQAFDTGYAMEIFMEDNDFTQLLPLNNPVLQKSVNLKVNTANGTGTLYALKNFYVG